MGSDSPSRGWPFGCSRGRSASNQPKVAELPGGRLTSIAGSSATVGYLYDRFGRITQDGALGYSYDRNSNRTGIGYPGSVSISSTCDFADRQATLSVAKAAPGAKTAWIGWLTLLGLVLSCAYGTRAPRIVQGQDFPADKVQTLREGLSAAEVRAAVGEPLEVEKQDGGERWRYYARERKDGVTYILGFIPKKSPHFVWDYELILVMSGGQVESVEYEETKIK